MKLIINDKCHRKIWITGHFTNYVLSLCVQSMLSNGYSMYHILISLSWNISMIKIEMTVIRHIMTRLYILHYCIVFYRVYEHIHCIYLRTVSLLNECLKTMFLVLLSNTRWYSLNIIPNWTKDWFWFAIIEHFRVIPRIRLIPFAAMFSYNRYELPCKR